MKIAIWKSLIAPRDASTWVRRAALVLLTVHALLLALSIPRNAITIDEVLHLPVGMSYWQRGEFWPYHHNPPLVRLLFSIPAVVLDVPIDYENFHYVPRSRRADCDLGRDFMLLNRNHYLRIYTTCRLVVAALSVLGGLLVFRWSRALFGDAGGLVSLSLWTFSPNVLAHAGLVTPDVGATVIGFLATYAFWRYLARPSLLGAYLCGILLGLTLAAKFSFVLLPLIWLFPAAVKLFSKRREDAADNTLSWKRAAGHATTILLVSLLLVNECYLWEGTGRRLGAFDFRSKTLSVERTREGDPARRPVAPRENRFRGTFLANLPVPLPEHFLLGFDDQMYDVDCGFCKYLRGERRHGPGWWYYYLYALLVKSPLGTLGLGALAALLFFRRGYRADLLGEAAILSPIVVFLAAISAETGLNSHLRYVLPIYPFAFVFVGRVGRLSSSRWRVWTILVACALAANAISVLRVHPHYLTYFNEAAGGPLHGMDHLADSNIDWGQGLVALRDWLNENAAGRRIRLAYFGTMFPEVLGIDYELPPLDGPAPGLQAVSANYLLGVPFPAPNGEGRQSPLGLDALIYYRRFEPIAVPGNSIFVYDLTPEEVNRARHELGVPPWREQ